MAEAEAVVGAEVGLGLTEEHAPRNAAKRIPIKSILWRCMRAMLADMLLFDKARERYPQILRVVKFELEITGDKPRKCMIC